LRFLLTPRWIGLLLVMVVVAFACVLLGRWQFDRYHERQDRNHQTEANLAADPVPVEQVFSTDTEPDDDQEWQVVRATGRYDADHQIVVLYRTNDGAPGVDVVVPLVTDGGAALLVDRGWVPSAANGQAPTSVPAPPAGSVTVTGWARIDSDDSGDRVRPTDGQVRSISAGAIAETLPYPVYDGFVERTAEQPSVKPAPEPPDPPDLGSGPSLFYGIQWFFFAALALGFWGYFAWAEYRTRTRSKAEPPADVAAPV